MFWALSWFEDAWDSSKGNVKKLTEIEEIYNKYKPGVLTKGQNDYR